MPIARCFDGMDIETLPVQVVSKKASKSEVFANLAEARKAYPMLDPACSSKDFTWASYGEVDRQSGFAELLPAGRYAPDRVVALRFEDWKSNEILSI